MKHIGVASYLSLVGFCLKIIGQINSLKTFLNGPDADYL